jgi:hypothetical protein
MFSVYLSLIFMFLTFTCLFLYRRPVAKQFWERVLNHDWRRNSI